MEQFKQGSPCKELYFDDGNPRLATVKFYSNEMGIGFIPIDAEVLVQDENSKEDKHQFLKFNGIISSHSRTLANFIEMNRLSLQIRKSRKVMNDKRSRPAK